MTYAAVAAADVSMIVDSAAGLLDLRLRGRRRGAVSLDGELLGQLAFAEDLDVSTSLGTMPFVRSDLEVDRRAGIEHLLEQRDVDRERFDAVRVLEAALRNTARHRHLTTLEREARAVVTRAGLLALDALTGRLASTRAATATKALLHLGRAVFGWRLWSVIDVVSSRGAGRGIWRGNRNWQVSRSTRPRLISLRIRR